MDKEISVSYSICLSEGGVKVLSVKTIIPERQTKIGSKRLVLLPPHVKYIRAKKENQIHHKRTLNCARDVTLLQHGLFD